MKSLFRPVVTLAVLLFLVAGAQAEELKVGAKAPTFQSTDESGKPWKSADHVGKQALVVYFYPADFTGGCTKQACAFRDDSELLKAKGAAVIGVSGDTASNHMKFKDYYKLTFTLLADTDGAVAKAFGVPTRDGGLAKTALKDSAGNAIVLEKRGVTSPRWTFVIDKNGKIVYINQKVNAAEDSKQVLAVLEKLGG